ncbi:MULTISPECIES: ZIP family metal transporter [unclassified Robiginitalea]|uniref:ZIP family metal transporter n=1 Tax=Robiginitalea TaxID=252306 RepID=UPI00234B0EFC|nr:MULTISPECIES: ZIP family metal transporter [unclassified Robiginitalea]MDC6354306.1 ZIP family metal transporter [Robiginitalea sp. PM2]MDC6374573.1 ZIP family metal transporter [Robiginitalea sp. SP8]
MGSKPTEPIATTPWHLILPALAVLLSFLFLVARRKRQAGRQGLLLAFSGAFLLGITLLELIPEAYNSGNPRLTGVFVGVGILLQIVLEFLSRGAEHGHVHTQTGGKFPLLLLLGLSLHALLEGVPLENNREFLLAIVIHKIPVALILGGFLLRSGLSAGAAWTFMVLFAAMTPLGALAGRIPVLEHGHPYVLGLVIGVLLHVSTVILFESSEGHSFNLRKLTAIVLGMVLAYLA